jgi:hypothetical protein
MNIDDAYHKLKSILSLAHVALLDAGVSVPDFDQDISPAIRELADERDQLKQKLENIMDSLNLKDVSDYVDFMWQEYGDCDPDKLSPAAAKIRDMLRKSAGVDRLRTLAGELAGALKRCAILIDNTDCSNGFCMCGGSIKDHIINENHNFVDSGWYHAEQTIQSAKTELEKAKKEGVIE